MQHDHPARHMERLVGLVRAAGERIMAIYGDAFEVELKDDDSPITAADVAANQVLVEGLRAYWPDIPVVSEETAHAPLAERQRWRRFWLIDPLDGTREFVDRNGEFTVNVALIEDGRPRLGLIGVPAEGTVLSGDVQAAVAERHGSRREPIRCRPMARPPVVVCSRRHRGAALQALLQRIDARFGGAEHLAVGSALKLARLAEGRADVYPRIGPTSQWDIAAGHALVLAAGGILVRIDGAPLDYVQRGGFLNPDFLAWGDASVDLRLLGADLDGVSLARN